MNESMKSRLEDASSLAREWFNDIKNGDFHWRAVLAVLAVFLLILILLGWYWSQEPDSFDVEEIARSMAPPDSARLVTGSITTATTIHLMETLLDKPGG